MLRRALSRNDDEGLDGKSMKAEELTVSQVSTDVRAGG